MANCGSGIPVSPSLTDAFAEVNSGDDIRFVKVQIVNDELVETARQPATDNIENDWNEMFSYIKDKNPCYILFRGENLGANGQWVLVSYVPDGAPVKSRMLYASTRDLLKRQLGYSFFADEIHGSNEDEITWELFQQHNKTNGNKDAPLTEAEMQYASEIKLEIDYGHTREYVHSVAFPMSMEAVNALKEMNNGNNNFVQLSVDLDNETIELVSTKVIGIGDLPSEIPDDHPSFSFFKYSHNHDGNQVSPMIFVYACTDNAPIKERMLYSTVKSAAQAQSKKEANVSVDHKLEVSEGADLTIEYIHEKIHPVERKVIVNKISRPSRPGGKRSTRGRPQRKRK
eukprot:TRINITY_DN13711_c0_g1_i1.p1 TRINITY_DN13711_c0_g1~~TRINITY_DN13711_c0_g1_i1.p1  ORF type:complete len:342 (+),score=143.87 TRINITY_DN13711_c0_g1_i1:51-1076(+)